MSYICYKVAHCKRALDIINKDWRDIKEGLEELEAICSKCSKRARYE